VDHPDEGHDNFSTKLKGQMESASPSAQRLMAEMVWALLLFPSNINISTKRKQINDVWSMSGESLREDVPMLNEEVLSGIGSGGTGYNTLRWREMVYLISLVGDLKQRASGERQNLLSDYDAFVEWIAHLPQQGERQFRHMLRFFCFPDRVERMSSNRDRRSVIAGFDVATEKETKNWSDRQLDDALLTLRSKLQEADPSLALDFYEDPLQNRWGRSGKGTGDSKGGGLVETSARNQIVAFSVKDCEIFTRYPNSVSWDDVADLDKALFKSVRERLKSLAELVATKSDSAPALKAATSLATPNGRSPRDIWCCVYPVSVSNKSYGLQVGLIISQQGAEVCFCMGAGTSQVKGADKRTELETELIATRGKLANSPTELVSLIEQRLKRKWYFRRSWKGEPNISDFSSLGEWIKYASSPQGNGASVSIYLSPTELQERGPEVVDLFEEALETFWTLFEYVYGIAPQRSAPFDELSSSGSDTAIPAIDFDARILVRALADIKATKFRIEKEFLSRFVSSLVAKPFLILTGNSGTGKTKLAELFVQWLCRNSDNGFALVPVGADWTDNRNVLGFVNHLRLTTVKEEGEEVELPVYQTTKILDLLLGAARKENERKPHFLILDEMNLSHVERYFADFLSAIESKDAGLLLHREGRPLPRKPGGPCDVPETLGLPRNVFVIGTVNVDETTYMFSPKVLDRANVIEFRVGADAPEEFLKAGGLSLVNIVDAPAGCAEGFLELSFRSRSVKGPALALVADPDSPPPNAKEGIEKSLTVIRDLFALMQKRHQEFAFRSMAEILRFLAVDYELIPEAGDWNWKRAIDAQILQKILPKLHGSKRKIGSLLAALAKYCEQGVRADAESLLSDETKVEAYLAAENKREESPAFEESYLKLCEMMEVVRRDQFVSFIQ
jgi:5-methylcytosine-specific restriction protein B